MVGWDGGLGGFAAAEIYTALQATKSTCRQTLVLLVATSSIFREQRYKEMKGEEVRVRKMGSKGGAKSARDGISAHEITSKQPVCVHAKTPSTRSSL